MATLMGDHSKINKEHVVNENICDKSYTLKEQDSGVSIECHTGQNIMPNGLNEQDYKGQKLDNIEETNVDETSNGVPVIQTGVVRDSEKDVIMMDEPIFESKLQLVFWMYY